MDNITLQQPYGVVLSLLILLSPQMAHGRIWMIRRDELNSLGFQYTLTYLLRKEGGREWREFPFIDSLSKSLQQPGQGRVESERQDLTGGWQEDNDLSHHCCFPASALAER